MLHIMSPIQYGEGAEWEQESLEIILNPLTVTILNFLPKVQACRSVINYIKWDISDADGHWINLNFLLV